MRMFSGWLVVLFAVLVTRCGGDDDDPCKAGSEGCECYRNDTCDNDLTCASNTCVDLTDAGSDSSLVDGGSTDACPSVEGEFLAVHEQLDGSCSVVQPTSYGFENEALSTVEETGMAGILRTKVNRMGCTLEVTRTRLDNANNEQWQMTGTLDIDDSDTLTGTMTRYEWGAGGQIACQGLYSTTMTKVDPAATD